MKKRAAGVVIASTLASLLGAEVAVRVVAPQEARLETPGMFIRDSALGYRLSPRYRGHRGNRVEYMTTITTDDIGLRSSDEGAPDAPTRIVVLGDSFAFGQGVEASEAFPSRLEKELGASHLPVHVLNAGTPGYGTRQQAAWLERFGARLAPDLVILSVFLGNDLRDNIVPGEVRLIQGAVAAPAASWHSPVSVWLYRNSHLYALARTSAIALTTARDGDRIAQPSAVDAFMSQPSEVAKLEVDSTRVGLARLLEVSRQLNAPLLAVLIPDAFQVEKPRIDWLARQPEYRGRVDIARPNRTFAKLFCELGIPFLDLTPAFSDTAAAADETLYFPRDRHWNARGHGLAARLIASPVKSAAVNREAGEPLANASPIQFQLDSAQGLGRCASV